MILLYSNTLIYRSQILENTDMDSYIVTGIYSMSDADSLTIKNVAFVGPSIFEVIRADVYIIQRQSGINMTVVKTRFRNSYGIWTNWKS